MKKLVGGLVLVALVQGCVEQPPARRAGANAGAAAQREAEEVRRRVASTTAPTPQHPLNVAFGGKVTLLGYDISGQEARPGTTLTVTWYWRVDASTGDGWRLFTHLDDAQRPRVNRDSEGDVRRAYQPERWRRGEFVTDRQTIEIPNDWDAPIVRVYTGLWKNDERMPVSNANGRPMNDGRALAFELNTGVAARPAQLSVVRLAGALEVDGRLDETEWQHAEGTGALGPTRDGTDEAHGSVKLLWNDEYLYLGWEVRDEHLTVTPGGRDAHYWERDAVELLLDPDGDGRNYYELQVAPNGNTFDSQQPQPPSGDNFGTLGWNPALRVAVQRNGTVDTPGDRDVGYTVEVAIPWSELRDGLASVPPRAGATLRANLYVLDAVERGGQRSAAWVPMPGSFHDTSRFGVLTLEPLPANLEGRAAPPAPAAPSGLAAPGPAAAH